MSTAVSSRASGTAIAPRPHHEPEENETPEARVMNLLLAQVDEAMALLVERGAEGPLLARIRKHLPDFGKPAAPAPTADCEHAGDWTKVVAVLRMFSGRRLSQEEHAALGIARQIVNAEMVRTRGDLKGGAK